MDLKTPDYNLSEFPNVYDPSEDTFLFLDGLEAEYTYIKNLQPKIAVEIGSGSGIVITALSYILNDSCLYFSTDINIEACNATKNTSYLNNASIESLNMNLLDSFKDGIFDIILFNPPYVPTDSEEIFGSGLNRAWAGGTSGRVIIDKLLSNLSSLLTNNGVCYMVLLKENNLDEISKIMEKYNMKSEIIIERKIPGEHLYICKFSKL